MFVLNKKRLVFIQKKVLVNLDFIIQRRIGAG